MRTALLVALLLVVPACGSSSSGGSPSSAAGESRNSAIYSHAYSACRTQAAAIAAGGGGSLYPLAQGYPLSAIGAIRPDGRKEWRTLKQGCAAGELDALATTDKAQAKAVCQADAEWLVGKEVAKCRAPDLNW
jgi:hypothetical protein